jgi:DNA polymerase-3 subunit delta'
VSADDRPAGSLFAEVVGQESAVAELRAAARRPVHAYLLRGAAGNGGLVAALGFAAALLCDQDGCGECPTCRAALAGSDPDLHVVRRSGAALSVDDMRTMVGLAQRRPLHASRQVVILTDVHLAGKSAPALLKTLEEPPGQSVFILLADELTPELATVASRCVQIEFPPVPRTTMVSWLRGLGLDDEVAAVVADSSSGSPGRARIMMDDPDVAERASLWSSVPERLNGSGVVAAELVRSLVASTERAVEPLRAEHARVIERLTDEAKEMGERALPGRKEITEQQAREERRWRTDALRAGLGALARAYAARCSAAAGAQDARDGRSAAAAVTLITETATTLPRNPNESLLLQALLVRLGALAA